MTPNTIDTPDACPGGCGARVSIERVPTKPDNERDDKPFDLAMKREVLDADGTTHTCADADPDARRARRLARSQRHAQRDDARAKAKADRDARHRDEIERAAARAALLEPARPKLWVPGGGGRR